MSFTLKKISVLGVTNAKAWLRIHFRVFLAVALTLLIISVVYGNDLSITANESLQNEAFSYVLLLPFFVVFLLYLKKDVILGILALDRHVKTPRLRHVNELIGVILCLVALILYWYGSNTFYPLEYHVGSMPLFIMGLVVIFLNFRAAKALILPVFFLLFLVPIPSTFLSAAGGAMANFNTEIAYGVLKAFRLPISISTAYGAPTFLLSDATGQPASFTVDVPCSGIYSLVALVMIGAFLALILYTSVVKKIYVFIFGFSVFALLNLLRLITVVSAAYWLGEQMALVLHSFAGIVLIFFGMLLVLVFSEKILKIRLIFKSQAAEPCSACSVTQRKGPAFCNSCGAFLQKSLPPVSKATFAKLLLILLGCSVAVLSVSAPTFATANGQIELTANPSTQNAASVFPAMPNYTLSFLYRDTAYEQVAQQDASLMYAYYPQNATDLPIYVDVGVSGSISNLHNWEVCLISMQTSQGLSPLVNELDSHATQLLNDTPVIAQYLVFDSPEGYRQVTLYWYERVTFNTGLTVEQKYVRISLIIMAKTSSNYLPLEQELLVVGQQIAAKWESMTTQSLISLGVPALQALLVALIALIALTATAQQMAQQRKIGNNLKLFNSFASYKEKLVLQTVLEATNQNKHFATNDIFKNLQAHMGKPINQKRVLSILKTLEKYGLVYRMVTSVNNTPVLVWSVGNLPKP